MLWQHRMWNLGMTNEISISPGLEITEIFIKFLVFCNFTKPRNRQRISFLSKCPCSSNYVVASGILISRCFKKPPDIPSKESPGPRISLLISSIDIYKQELAIGSRTTLQPPTVMKTKGLFDELNHTKVK